MRSWSTAVGSARRALISALLWSAHFWLRFDLSVTLSASGQLTITVVGSEALVAGALTSSEHSLSGDRGDRGRSIGSANGAVEI
jgi:hypothetical protein